MPTLIRNHRPKFTGDYLATLNAHERVKCQYCKPLAKKSREKFNLN